MVTVICRDGNDNVLFVAEVETIDQEKLVWEECKRYLTNVWLDWG